MRCECECMRSASMNLLLMHDRRRNEEAKHTDTHLTIQYILLVIGLGMLCCCIKIHLTVKKNVLLGCVSIHKYMYIGITVTLLSIICGMNITIRFPFNLILSNMLDNSWIRFPILGNSDWKKKIEQILKYSLRLILSSNLG